MGTLEIIIDRKDGPRTVYRGQAEWITDRVTMERVEGPDLPGYQPETPRGLEFHAAICRGHCWKSGLETQENWGGEFEGGLER
jgi:hypothetical protein